MNSKGLTLVELLVSMVVLATIITASLNFYENYSFKRSELGEYYTAKNLMAKGLEMARADYLKTGNLTAYKSITQVNGVTFQATVTKENVTKQYSFFTDSVPLIKMTSHVGWKGRELEVVNYVSHP